VDGPLASSYYERYILRITNRKQFFNPGELPLVLLALLADEPQGGYQLIDELGRRFAPAYKPSPGSVYPALTALRTESLILHVAGKRRGAYRISAEGRRLLASKHELLAQIEARTAAVLTDNTSLQPVVARFAERISHLNGRVDRGAVERILDNAAKAIADLEVTP
jgi:DNA-binding PadR family transcriptional regulator